MKEKKLILRWGVGNFQEGAFTSLRRKRGVKLCGFQHQNLKWWHFKKKKERSISDYD